MSRSAVIIVAEDDPVDRELMLEAWNDSGSHHTIMFVENGAELLEYLTTQSQTPKEQVNSLPSLILLDLNMPVMDGREALKKIKQSPEFRRIPIVVLTTSNAIEDISQCYDLGANSYVLKPSSFDRMVEVLSTIDRYWTNTVEPVPKG